MCFTQLFFSFFQLHDEGWLTRARLSLTTTRIHGGRCGGVYGCKHPQAQQSLAYGTHLWLCMLEGLVCKVTNVHHEWVKRHICQHFIFRNRLEIQKMSIQVSCQLFVSRLLLLFTNLIEVFHLPSKESIGSLKIDVWRWVPIFLVSIRAIAGVIHQAVLDPIFTRNNSSVVNLMNGIAVFAMLKMSKGDSHLNKIWKPLE